MMEKNDLNNYYIKDLSILLEKDCCLEQYWPLIENKYEIIKEIIHQGILDKNTFINKCEENHINGEIINKNLLLLKRFFCLYDDKSKPLKDIQDLSITSLELLKQDSIKNNRDFIILLGHFSKGEIIQKYKISSSQLEKIISLLNMMRLPGVKYLRANLYVENGIQSFDDFIHMDILTFQKKVKNYLQINHLSYKVPFVKELKTQQAVSKVLWYYRKEKINFSLSFHLMNELEKDEICSWKYPDIYQVYNLPDIEEMKKKKICFYNPKKFHSFYSFYIKELLVGYLVLVEKDREIGIGIGVHPSYVNQGIGKEILKIGTYISQIFYPKKPMSLEVRTWNQRSIACYLHNGFKINGKEISLNTLSGIDSFYKMVKEGE